MQNTNQLTQEELDSLIRAIYGRYGLDFSNYEPLSLSRRINRIIAKYNLENSLGLWRKIIYDSSFIQCFIDEITVGLTEMFRNQDFWIKLRTDVLPVYESKDNLSIWHAGCSTGEEVYSMAITLEEEEISSNVSIIATDLNSSSIRNARQGKFSSLYQKTYTDNYAAAQGKKELNAYYSLAEENMVFNKVSTHNIVFDQHNLVKDEMPQVFDMILCRNVMIYFDEVLKMKVLKLFHDCLPEGGFLSIGYYDTLPKGYKDLFYTYDASCKIYQKI
ncbi:protein-glutamate O-methyltransferase CheR [Xanthocytophaga agilis]|uniref:Protein-glutamate O-methyltransferase CheR n=1 Tax=Xanthocytophaga agilis TaxID=3048010 RepID=A0AAE3R5S7_9BACT|nr:protein-glutamate O-methyltransferase CheR [Xanthocytophaga agilis]MDJ1501925.1 protein-glutamate O-methyltransferase CheR [Xanthocytophaga agilis]